MLKIAPRLCSLFLATSLLLSALPAAATLEESLAPYPDDTLALLSVSLDYGDWDYVISRALKMMQDKPASADKTEADSAEPADQDKDKDDNDTGEAVPEEMEDMLGFLQKELGFDPLWDGLLNLGSHLTLAYRPYTGSNGHVMFSLNLRSPERIGRVMERLRLHLNRQGDHRSFVTQRFGPAEIYSVMLLKGDEGMAGFEEIHLAVSGQNLIGSFGPNADLLKRMLYIHSVLPEKSRFRLNNQPLFAPVRESLGNKALWFYLDTKGALKAAENIGGKLGVEASEDMADLAVLDQIASLYRGFGLGFNLDADAVRLKSFVAPDWQNLTPVQQDYLQAMNQKPQHDLGGLLERMPDDPVLVTAGQHLDVALTKPLPVDLPLDELPFGAEDIRKAVQSLLNIDYQKDFLPKIDGRFGFGLFKPGQDQEIPQVVLYLGLRDGQESGFDKLVQQQLQFNPGALESLGGDPSSESAVQENMRALSSMLENYAVDHKGGYPKDIKALAADAQSERDYWQELENPVSGKSGIGQALRDYAGMGTRPDVSLAGTVYYEPTSFDKKDESYGGYAIYGYDPSGVLYRITDQETDFETVLDVLPKAEVKSNAPAAIKPKQVDSFQGVPIFSLPLDLPAEGLPEDIEPVFARKGQVWMIGVNRQALRTALSGGSPERIGHWMSDTGSQDASWLFFADLQAGGQLLEKVLPDFIEKQEDLEAFRAAFKPWRSLFAAARQRPRGTEGHFVVDADLDKVDFGQLIDLAASSGMQTQGEDETEVHEDPNSGLKDNMDQLRSMLETYAEAHEGQYPADLEALRKHAEQNDYWQQLENPFDPEGAALLEYAAFSAGEAGRVLYKPVKDAKGKVVSYQIYASDSFGELLQEYGEPYLLEP